MEIENKNSLWRYLYFYELKAWQYGYVIQENSEVGFQISDPDKIYPISFYGLLTLAHPVWHDHQIQDLLFLVVKLVSKQEPNFAHAKQYQIIQFSFVNKEFVPTLMLHFKIERMKLKLKLWWLEIRQLFSKKVKQDE